VKLIQIKTKEDAAKIDRNKAYNIIVDALHESPWANYGTVSEERIDFIIKFYLDFPNPALSGLFMAMDDEGNIAGLLAGVLSQNVVGMAAQELMWYVVPEHRKSGVGIELIAMYEEWAKTQGVKLCSMSHYQNDTGDTLSKIFDKKGFKPIEHTYVKELK
jgi:GNAT superfamily N-acetyltransferase